MEKRSIAPLEKNAIQNVETKPTSSPGCCGGTPTTNADACCKLDEEKKAEGEAGCGCNTATETPVKKSSCC
jgi:hypothetical protein